ncbi:MAG TPA: glycosyltransferase family 4 protein [Caldilineae bacterium]|nr:glycosyltransferase family 4 protein [Caldilineae bacterium]
MRIAILGHFPVEAPPTGGVQSVIANLRDALARREGIELHLIQHRRGTPAGTFQRDGWTEHNLPAREGRIIPNMLRTAALLRPLLTELQPDVVSTHQPEYAAAALKMGLPTLHTIHGFPGDEFWKRKGLLTRSAMLLEAWQERATLRRARHLVAISDMVIARYRSRTRAVFHRIDNPVSPIFFQPAPPPDPHQLLLVGNLTPVKGIDTAIRAIAILRLRFPRLRLVIVGRESDPVYAARVRALAAPLGEAVAFRGPVSQAEVKALLDASLALALTSNQEHAPMIVSEAMAAGRPVVATRVGALPGMAEDGRTGYLVDAGDPDAAAAALARLLADPYEALAMGARAAQLARRRYHPDAVADAYLRAMRVAISSS